MSVGSGLRRWALVLSSSLLLTCGGGSPTAPPLVPAGSPVPTPTPTPVPVQTLCQRLGYVPTSDTPCSAQLPTFEAEVNAAIDRLMQQHPEYFETASNGVRIRNIGGYYVGVLDNLNSSGLCAGYDGEEIQVKTSNDFNDQFDISSAGGFVRRAYLTTCVPAAFPTPEPPPIPPPPGCHLPSSHEVSCGTSTPSFLGDVGASIDQLVQERPDLFNLDDTARGVSNGYKVLNPPAYFDGVAANLTKKGYCARFDGEEMVVKNTNQFSDHYDILTGDNHIRRGDGEYRTSCYPAAF